MKKTITLALLSASCIVSADEVRMRNIENRLTSLENSQNNCYMINPPARPYNPDCWGFYLTVDPLIWQASVNGTGIGIQTNGSTNFFNSSAQSKVKNLDFEWSWGFRLGAGLNLDYDAWDVFLQWTRWDTSGKQNVSANATEGIYPIFTHPGSEGFVYARNAEAKWELDYNILDLENAREFWVSKCLSLRPFAGLRAAWIDQKEFNLTFSELVNAAVQNISVQQSDRYWGIGIRTGLDTQWNIGSGFSVFNNFAGNLLYGYHSVKHKQINGETLSSDTGNFFHVGNAILDMQLGLAYDWMSCDCCYHLGFDLGWEQHWHPGMNQFMVFVDSTQNGQFVANQGDLGAQGYFLKVRFDF